MKDFVKDGKFLAKIFVQKQFKTEYYCSKKGKKMSRDTLVNPSLPLVLFSDPIVNPPAPQECHVLFE
jgi:hypothetical protein